MTYKVKLFAYLKDGRGPEIEVESEASSSSLQTALKDAGLPVHGCRLAVNNEFVYEDRPLEPGDTIALIPPVSGG